MNTTTDHQPPPTTSTQLDGAAWLALVETRANTLSLAVRDACTHQQFGRTIDDAYERLDEALTRAIAWMQSLRDPFDAATSATPIQAPFEVIAASLHLEQACTSITTARACGWSPRRTRPPSPPRHIHPGDEQISGLCSLKRHAQFLWTTETTYAHIARIVRNAAPRVLSDTGPWTATVHPARTGQPQQGPEALLRVIVKHSDQDRSIDADDAQRLGHFLHANRHLAAFEEKITIAANIDPRRLRYRVVFEQANIEHCDIEVLAPYAENARRRARWNQHSDRFSDWYDSHVAPDSLRPVDVIPLGMCETSENDHLDDPPAGYDA